MLIYKFLLIQYVSKKIKPKEKKSFVLVLFYWTV